MFYLAYRRQVSRNDFYCRGNLECIFFFIFIIYIYFSFNIYYSYQ